MQELRANTQVKVRVGPFPDVGDGFTPQTDITLGGNEAELLKHNGAATVDISGATWAAIANVRGWYDLTLTTSHTDTEGMLTVVVQDDSDCLPVFRDFMVLSEAAWDSKYVAKDTGVMDVHVKTIEGGIIANASFNADVGSTAHGTNIIALACRKILEELNIDHLLKVDTTVAADGDLETYCVAGTVMAHLMAAAADVTAYKASTDSMEAQKVHADTIKTEVDKIGTIPALDGGGQTIGAAIAKLADDNGGATFNAGEDSLNKIRDDRTLPAADYVVVGDTLARVTLVDTTTTNTDLVTAGAVKTAMEADGSDLSALMEGLINQQKIRHTAGGAGEDIGDVEIYDDAGNKEGDVDVAYDEDAAWSVRKRLFIA